MPRLLRNFIIVAVVLLLAGMSIWPPEKNLRLGKDLAGGVSLVYSVQIDPGESAEQIVPAIIEVLKNRVDPDGTSDIAFTRVGRDRIEITMPLPNEQVKRLKRVYEDALKELDAQRIDEAAFEDAMRSSGDERAQKLSRLAGTGEGREARLALLNAAAAAGDAAKGARATYDATRAELDAARAAAAEPARIDELTRRLEAEATTAAVAANTYDEARARVLRAVVSGDDVRQALERSRRTRSLYDAQARETVVQPSERDEAIASLKERYPDAAPSIDRVAALHDQYAAQRRSLDDPADLRRLLSGAGVLDFRITVTPGTNPMVEDDMRRQLNERGPRNARHDQVRWFKINRIETQYDTADQLRALRADPVGYFAARGYVVEEHDGAYWMLAYTTPGSRLTRAEGDWRVANSFQGMDELGRPAINFVMDATGAMLLSRLTGTHLGHEMAVLLDDEVYTAPTLNGRIGRSGQIEGQFSNEDLQYIIRTLRAGSLHAKLQGPISTDELAPEFGIDRLSAGLTAGLYSFLICAAFMIGYYFSCGLIAVIGLVLNCVLLIGIMGLVGAAFTLPGIAGVILTFAMAVDANVLIYERMREEMGHGADLRTAVRLGYQRALSAIVDGNLTNLIVCAVLYFVGTAEIRGFGLTMSIGVATTLFTQLFITRLLFDIFVDKLGWRRTSMLPTVVPAVQRAMTLNVDWMRWRPVMYSVFAGLIGLGFFMIVVRGARMLDTEFRGGTAITVKLQEPDGGRKVMTRAEIAQRVAAAAERHKDEPALRDLATAEVIVMAPEDDGVTSDTFRIKSLVTDAPAMERALSEEFKGLVGSQARLTFADADAERPPADRVYPVIEDALGENIDRPEIRSAVGEFRGGVAIVLDGIDPPTPVQRIEERIEQVRSQADFAIAAGRPSRVIALAQDAAGNATSAAVVVADPDASYFADESRWQTEVRDVEWRLVREALTRETEFLSSQNFSAAIAAAFAAQAVVAVLLSIALIVIYVAVRFNSVRFSVAAIVPTLLDCVSALGLIAMAEIITEWNPGLARALGLEAFKIDLTVVAALLTILGYSINDKIVVLDRIRENRGKLTYVSREVVNLSINQTMSRTIMTGTTTILSTIVLYFVGGEGVKPFAYSLGLGVIIGTASSVALGAPLVWSKRRDRTAAQEEADRTGTPGSPGAPVGIAKA